MRISGVILPPNKYIYVALTYIVGIGFTRAKKICTDLSIDMHKKTNSITDAEASAIEEYIADNYLVESALVSMVNANKKRLISINCFRGNKHKKRHKK